ncbi:hypothetical protein U1Q18_050873 [Sarracenia purpurea var. burkii]
MALGTVWYLAWCYYVYDTPEKHPRISEKEKMCIRKSLANSAVGEKAGLVTGISFFIRAGLQMFGGAATDAMIKRGMSKTNLWNKPKESAGEVLRNLNENNDA